jgi:two-component system alkaline phosphatase synthesis response regulator PhoP
MSQYSHHGKRPWKKKGVILISKRILIVEDDPGVLRATSYILEKEGYEVLSAQNGLEGLKKAKDSNPDLLLLDVMLPGIDGFEICHSLRGESETANLPILMFSAKGQETDKATGLKVGADEYITKPVDREVLISKVAAWLSAKG